MQPNTDRHDQQEAPDYAPPKRPGKGLPLWITILALLLAVAGVASAAYTYWHFDSMDMEHQGAVDSLLARGYYPLRQAMEACGYHQYLQGNTASFVKTVAGKAVTIAYDFAANRCDKKGYGFSLENNWMLYADEYYVHTSLLENITSHTITHSNGAITATPVDYAPHEWTTAFAPLVAHACGALRKAHANQTYTNGLSALVQNYELGHRVFEIDFRPTSDGSLAAVHTGMVPEDANGILMTQREWLLYTGLGSDIQPMLIGTVLDQMAINADMFIVLDIKENVLRALEILHAEAEKRDVSLLDRMIPQIHGSETYAPLMEIYPFPSVIFTTYQAEESPADVVSFALEQDTIRVIAVNAGDEALLEQYLALTAEEDILIYTHTLNQYDDIAIQADKGVHGLYTDFLLPSDDAIYRSIRGY